MVIVSGSLTVDPADRDSYLAAHRSVITAARAAGGCLDFHLSADPIEADRINVYEAWEAVEAVEAFRGSAPSVEGEVPLRGGHVQQHEVASTTELLGSDPEGGGA